MDGSNMTRDELDGFGEPIIRVMEAS